MGESQPSQFDLMDFCSYYYTVSLVTVIVAGYLSAPSRSCYSSFYNKWVKLYKNLTMDELLREMLCLLVEFVSEATELYHKADNFEDGYVFNQSERDSFDIIKNGGEDEGVPGRNTPPPKQQEANSSGDSTP